MRFTRFVVEDKQGNYILDWPYDRIKVRARIIGRIKQKVVVIE